MAGVIEVGSTKYDIQPLPGTYAPMTGELFVAQAIDPNTGRVAVNEQTQQPIKVAKHMARVTVRLATNLSNPGGECTVSIAESPTINGNHERPPEEWAVYGLWSVSTNPYFQRTRLKSNGDVGPIAEACLGELAGTDASGRNIGYAACSSLSPAGFYVAEGLVHRQWGMTIGQGRKQ